MIFWGDYLFTKVLYALEFGLEAGIMNSQPGEPGGTPAKNAWEYVWQRMACFRIILANNYFNILLLLQNFF